MRKAYIWPCFDKENDFIVSQSKALIYNNFEISLSLKNIFSIDLFVLNWYENIYKSKFQYVTYFKRIALLILLRILNKKIVFYVHNIRPHQKNDIEPCFNLSHNLFVFLLKMSDSIVVLSKSTPSFFSPNIKKKLEKSGKLYIIPHPNMVHLWNKSSKKIEHEGRKLKLLSFGPIIKYKGVEHLIRVMNDLESYPIEVLIAGICEKNYQLELINMSKNKNVLFSFRFFDNSEISELFSRFDICVFPLDIRSVLNSSSIILSFSMAKSVIATRNATLLDYDLNNFYMFDYLTESECVHNLKKTILTVYNDKQLNTSVLDQKGENCQKAVIQSNSQENINIQYLKMINDIYNTSNLL